MINEGVSDDRPRQAKPSAEWVARCAGREVLTPYPYVPDGVSAQNAISSACYCSAGPTAESRRMRASGELPRVVSKVVEAGAGLGLGVVESRVWDRVDNTKGREGRVEVLQKRA